MPGGPDRASRLAVAWMVEVAVRAPVPRPGVSITRATHFDVDEERLARVDGSKRCRAPCPVAPEPPLRLFLRPGGQQRPVARQLRTGSGLRFGRCSGTLGGVAPCVWVPSAGGPLRCVDIAVPGRRLRWQHC